MNERLKYGFIGDPSALLNDLQGELDLAPFEAGTTGLNGIFIAGPEANVSKEQLAEFFEAGLSVAVANASPDIMGALQEITCCSQAGSSPLLVYARLPGGSFSIATAGPSSVARLEAPVGDSAAPTLASPAPALLRSDSLAELFKPVSAGSPVLRAAGEEGFQPTAPGTAYGSDSFDLSLSGLINQPSGCDRHINDGRTTKQQYRGQVKVKLHCYWVDGEKVPHFIVIVKQSVHFNPAESGFTAQHTWTYDGWTKGYLLYALDYEPCSLKATGARRVSLETWAPKVQFDDAQGLGFAHQMGLRYREGGARANSFSFTAKSDEVNSFRTWSCKQRANPDVAETSWRFHQRQCWDPTVNPPHRFPDWYSEMYKYGSKHGYVRDDFPEQSRTPLATSTISAWRIDCDSVPGPKGAPVPKTEVWAELSGSVWARFALFHCQEGCTEGRNHLFLADYGTWFQGQRFQLDKLCQPL